MKTCGGCPECGYIRCRCDLPLLLGNSLSGCMRDILSGAIIIEQVVCIVAGTRIPDELDWEVWMDSECRTAFRQYSRQAVYDLVKALKPRIVQPRLFGFECNTAGRERWRPAPING